MDFDILRYNVKPVKNFKLKLKIHKFKKNLKKTTKLIKRDQESVYRNYQESWNKNLSLKNWKNYKNIEEYSFPKIENGKDTSKIKRIILFQNEPFKISLYNWYRLNVEIKLDFIKNCVVDEPIVELGCGIGRNIFGFSALKLKNDLEGYEYTLNGNQVCEEIKNHFNLNIKFGQINLAKKIDNINLENKTIFTSHVLEQLKYDTEQVINNILEKKPKQVIHFEPIIELANNDEFGKIFVNHIKNNDYQQNLLHVLRKFEEDGKIKLKKIVPNFFAMNYLNQTSIIHWIPK